MAAAAAAAAVTSAAHRYCNEAPTLRSECTTYKSDGPKQQQAGDPSDDAVRTAEIGYSSIRLLKMHSPNGEHTHTHTHNDDRATHSAKDDLRTRKQTDIRHISTNVRARRVVCRCD
jgi:hypothetical protein